MCGLLFTNDPSLGREQFERGLGCMHHRGPDAAGCVAYEPTGMLGHNRLAILDLDRRSDQPFRSADGRYVMVYNGEIYNYRELASRYGLPTRTAGDTEVLLELFLRLGADLLPQLYGMFAFVILDTATGSVFAARDRLGVKPLYYRTRGDFVAFSSEIAGMLELYPERPIDEVAVRQYRKLRTFFNGRTLYDDISMFPAGCYWRDGKTTRYWSLPQDEQEGPSDDELRELVDSAVQYRAIADVEVGSYLSGGLDSTIVAGLIHRPHTWTVGTATNNEFGWARIAAERFESTHHEVVITEGEFVEVAKDLISVRREPLSVPNEVLLYSMTRAVKQYNTVVLSGEGADELFFGYDRVFRWAAGATSFDLREFDELYSYGRHRDDEILEDALAPFLNRSTPLGIVASFFQIAHLHGLLRRLDNATMRASVEARVPFVDHRLIERMAGVPYAYRAADNIVKAPLKRAFADLVPRPLIERPKVGFPVDLAKVFVGYGRANDDPMDKWFSFNLEVLGVDV